MLRKETTPSIRKKTNRYIILLVLSMTTIVGCHQIKYHDKPVQVDLLNELQGCEEVNVHFTIEKIYGNSFRNYEGRIVLPVFDSNFETDSLNNLFFPEFSDRRLKFSVIGFLSENSRTKSEYGCIGAYQIKITEILKVEDVTNRFNYPIRN